MNAPATSPGDVRVDDDQQAPVELDLVGVDEPLDLGRRSWRERMSSGFIGLLRRGWRSRLSVRVQAGLEDVDLFIRWNRDRGLAAAFEVAEDPRLGRAHLDAGREQPLRDPVVAEGALVGGMGPRVEIPGAVGAGLDAVAAARCSRSRSRGPRRPSSGTWPRRGRPGRRAGSRTGCTASARRRNAGSPCPQRPPASCSAFGSIVLTVVSPFFRMMYRSTHVRKKNGWRGTLFSVLHASMQRAQPMHLSTETPNPYHFPSWRASFAYAFEGRTFRIPPIAPPERRTERKPLRNVLRSFTVPPPANGDNGIASRRISRRAGPGRSSERASPSCPSRPCRGISHRIRGSAAWSV